MLPSWLISSGAGRAATAAVRRGPRPQAAVLQADLTAPEQGSNRPIERQTRRLGLRVGRGQADQALLPTRRPCWGTTACPIGSSPVKRMSGMAGRSSQVQAAPPSAPAASWGASPAVALAPWVHADPCHG